MPAAAVIPAPIAYIKVVAVKKLVVGFLLRLTGPFALRSERDHGSTETFSGCSCCTSLCAVKSGLLL